MFKRTKSNQNWIKMEVDAIGEDAVAFLSYIRNDLHLRVCRRNAITNAVMLSCVRRRMLDVWECNHVRHLWGVIIPNHFDDRLWLRHFRLTKPTFEMLCNESGPLVSSVIHSMICWGKSFFYILRNLFCKCVPLYMSSYWIKIMICLSWHTYFIHILWNLHNFNPEVFNAIFSHSLSLDKNTRM